MSLLFSILLHVVSVAALFWFGSYCPQNGWLWLGEGIFTLILVAEHLLVTPTRQRNIGIAFGTLNGIASTVLAVFVITALCGDKIGIFLYLCLLFVNNKILHIL